MQLCPMGVRQRRSTCKREQVLGIRHNDTIWACTSCSNVCPFALPVSGGCFKCMPCFSTQLLKSKYPYCITTEYSLGFLIVSLESLRNRPVVGVHTVPFGSVFLQRRKEWMVSAYTLSDLMEKRDGSTIPNSSLSDPDASTAAFRPISE